SPLTYHGQPSSIPSPLHVREIVGAFPHPAGRGGMVASGHLGEDVLGGRRRREPTLRERPPPRSPRVAHPPTAPPARVHDEPSRPLVRTEAEPGADEAEPPMDPEEPGEPEGDHEHE